MSKTRVAVAVVLAAVMFLGGAVLLSAGGGSTQPVTVQGSDNSSLLESPLVPASDLDRSIAVLEGTVERNEEDWHALADLGAAYLQKAHQSADPAFYRAAQEALERSLALKERNLPALLGVGQLSLARHRFARALEVGQEIVRIDPFSSTGRGVVGDAYIGLGRYRAAFAAFQRMVNVRPDLASYARVSYARELIGDVDGALKAMRRAAEAAGPVPYNAAWTQNQIGDLLFNSNRLKQARIRYRLALRYLPEFDMPRVGLARIDAARGNLKRAIARLQRVVTRLPVPAYVATLGDLYWASGHKAAAYRQYELVRAQHKLLAANGVQPDPEMTLFLADHGIERARAIRQARHQYNKRPSIYAADALAWALYAAGAPRPAQRYVGSALRLGTRDASLFFHAGMIHKALGNISRARSYLRRTLAINPHFSIRHSQVAARALAALRSP